MDIMELLGKLDGSPLSEESKQEIQNVFATIVSEKVEAEVAEKTEALVKEAVDKALEELDESHASQLEKLLVAIDEDHSAKLTKLVQRLDEDHTAKLQNIVTHYETAMTEDAKRLTEALSNDISNFLDLSVSEVMPKNLLKEAVANTKAQDTLAKIKEIVSVDPEYMNQHIKDALVEGKEKIDALRADLNEVLKENVKLSAKSTKLESELVLERKISSYPAEKRQLLAETFKGKSADFINENFDVTLKMLNRKDKDERQSEKDFIINESVARTVDTPKDRGAVNTPSQHSYVEDYVSGLN